MITVQPICVLPRAQAEQYTPQPGEVCVSITNPRQSPARLGVWQDILRLGFHDIEQHWGNFIPMQISQAAEMIQFCHEHRDQPVTIHCEYGSSRSVAAGLFVAAWLKRPLLLPEPVLAPNPQVIRQLRRAALRLSFTLRDWRLLWVALRGPQALRYSVLPAVIADTYLD